MNKSSSNFNQALWLGIGQIGIFAVAFLGAAILSRFLSKEEYGTYRQILYVYTTMMSLFTIGLPSVFSYFIPRLNTSQQKTLINSLNRIFLLLGALFSLTLFLLSSVIAGWLKNPELAIGLKIFSIFPLFTLPTLGVEGIYTALRKTKTTALYQLFSRTLMLLLMILPVIIIKADYKFAIIGWGISSFITFLVAMYMKSKPYVKIEKEIIPNMYKTIFNYSLPLMGAFIAGFFISSADQFYISRYYGTEAFADYSNGSFSIPIVALIATSVKNVLLPLFSKADSDGNINSAVKSYINAVNKSIILVFPILVYSLFFAKEILVIIYGEKYASSETYMRFHIIRDFLAVFPYFSVFLAFGMSKVYLNMHILGAIYVWIFGFIVVKAGLDPSMIVLVRTLFYVACTIYALRYLFIKMKINLMPREVVNQLIKASIHSFICALPLYLIAKNSIVNEFGSLYIIIITISIFYLELILSGKAIKTNYIESVMMLIKRK